MQSLVYSEKKPFNYSAGVVVSFWWCLLLTRFSSQKFVVFFSFKLFTKHFFSVENWKKKLKIHRKWKPCLGYYFLYGISEKIVTVFGTSKMYKRFEFFVFLNQKMNFQILITLALLNEILFVATSNVYVSVFVSTTTKRNNLK